MNNTISPLFFIHIPKTAGSSFRKAAEAYFGSQHTLCDYGNTSKETHPKIIEYEYERNDRFAAGEHIINNARFFSGHVHFSKYAPFFHPKNILTFMRSPEQKIRSQFEHHVRNHNYQSDFKKFISEKRFTNTQSRILNGLGIEGFGFVGLAEEYETSLTLINTLYKTDFKALRLNINQKKNKSSYILNKQEIDLIHKYNQDDIDLYKKACIRFQKQKQSIESSTPFIRFDLIQPALEQAQHKIKGWITCYESNDAQKIGVFINGHQVETIIANEYCDIANKHNMNRKGFIGFTYHFPQNLSKNDTIELYSITNNELVYSTHYK